MQAISYSLVTLFSVSLSLLVGGAFSSKVSEAMNAGHPLFELLKALGGM